MIKWIISTVTDPWVVAITLGMFIAWMTLFAILPDLLGNGQQPIAAVLIGGMLVLSGFVLALVVLILRKE